MCVKSFVLLLAFITLCFIACQSQIKNAENTNRSNRAMQFLQSLTAAQKEKAQLSFDNEERYNWHYVPLQRKGIPLKELTGKQVNIGMDLLHTALSDTGF